MGGRRGRLHWGTRVLPRALAVLALVTLSVGGLVLGSTVGASPGQNLIDLNSGVTATQMAQSLVGVGINVSNVAYTGDLHAAGEFSGLGAIGFESGITLSSGAVATSEGGDLFYTSNILGPNVGTGTTAAFGTLGDTDLDAIVTPDVTEDASVLQFDFVPSGNQITFQYVFGSEEYNEFVNEFNDVFAFYVNGTNCATVGGHPVSVNTINLAVNPDLYRDNSTTPGPATIDTELDGLTTVLTCTAKVTPGASNHVKLAIADTRDDVLDSTVFLAGGSFRVNHAPTATADDYFATQDVPLNIPAPGC